MAWALVFCFVLAESQDWFSHAIAEQAFYDAFAQRIEKAKSSFEKAILARAIFEYCRSESNAALQAIAVREAQKLAGDAGQGPLCADIAKWQAKYQQANANPDSIAWSDKAESLWAEALLSKVPSQRLLLQSEALTLWLASGARGIRAPEWSKRVATIKEARCETPLLARSLWQLDGRVITFVNRKSALIPHVLNASLRPGETIIIHPTPVTENAQWHVTILKRKYIRLTCVLSNLCLSMKEAENDVGRYVVMQHNPQVDESDWTLIPTADGWFLILNTYTHLCIGPENDSTATGTPLVARAVEPDNPALHWRPVLIR